MDQSAPRVDVLVIGGGIAGLVAANRAAQLGKSVVVLEKGADEKYPCNTRYTGGTFHINYTDVRETGADKLLAMIETVTEGTARADLARAVAADSSRLIRWLEDEGVGLVNLGSYHTAVLAPASRRGPGLIWQGVGGDVALDRLEANLRQRQGRIVRGARAHALKLAGTDGVMVEARQGDATIAFRAGAVVIADGGFQANLEMVREHIAPEADKLVQRNGGTATGDGLRLAQAAGAAITELDMFYGHLLSREAITNPLLWPRPLVDDIAVAGIMVDADGRRFVDEGLGGVFLSNVIARLPDPLATSLVFDQPIWDGPGRAHAVPPNSLVPDNGGTLHRADNLRDLAGLMGLPTGRLEETVGAYNAALDSGALGALTPPRRGEKHRVWPIRTAPFYAMPVCVGITNTMGGIVVDGNGVVLDTKGAAIPGLHAAVSTIGGLNGGPHAGYVGGLINTVVALRAAEAIAR